MEQMRQEDGEELHPKAKERMEQEAVAKANAKKRLAGSIAMGSVGLWMMLSGSNPYLGLIAACLGFGLATVSDLKALKP